MWSESRPGLSRGIQGGMWPRGNGIETKFNMNIKSFLHIQKEAAWIKETCKVVLIAQYPATFIVFRIDWRAANPRRCTRINFPAKNAESVITENNERAKGFGGCSRVWVLKSTSSISWKKWHFKHRSQRWDANIKSISKYISVMWCPPNWRCCFAMMCLMTRKK